MPAAPSQPAAAPVASPPRSPFAPVLVWSLIQGGALALVASRVPFFATKSFPQPAEVLALGVMLFVQIGGSALLFPFLLRDARAATMVLATTVPFTVLAGFLTGAIDVKLQPAAAGFVVAWILGLALWRIALRSDRAKAAGVVVATLLACGGPLAWYLHAEYVLQSSTISWGDAMLGGPFFAALAVSTRDVATRPAWVFIGGHLILAGLAALFSRLLPQKSAFQARGTIEKLA